MAPEEVEDEDEDEDEDERVEHVEEVLDGPAAGSSEAKEKGFKVLRLKALLVVDPKLSRDTWALFSSLSEPSRQQKTSLRHGSSAP